MPKLILVLFLFISGPLSLYAQKISGRLQFEPGKTITIRVNIKNIVAQQAGSQAIDITADGWMINQYQVIKTDKNNTALHHSLQKIGFDMEGMGHKTRFDSDNAADLQAPAGEIFKSILDKKYDIIIDSNGSTLTTIPDTMTVIRDERLLILNDILKYLGDGIYPPKKGTPSYFAVLPAHEISVGESWIDSVRNSQEQSVTVSTLSALTDSTIIVTFNTTSVTNTTRQLMGAQATTKLNNIITGKTIVDRTTGIIREKTSDIDSNGTTQMMGNTLPINVRTHIVQVVQIN